MAPRRPGPVICDCGEGAGADALVPIDEALRQILARVSPVAETERLPLDRAHGRVLVWAYKARSPLPPFDNSAMDGYALRLGDLAGDGPWALPLAGRIEAGEGATIPWPAGSVLRVLTGAPVPEGCDAVIMQEEVTLPPPGDVLHIARRPVPGANIRRLGADVAAGTRLLSAGRVLDPRAMAVLAASGSAEARVRRKVRVALFSTGSELRTPGEPLGPGQIWNANRYHLSGALALPWVDLLDLGIVPDRPDDMAAVLERAAYGADLVISTGGVALGDEDHMPAVLERAGAEIRSMRLAIRPGKPLATGRVGKAVFLGLPGNPMSAFVTWHMVGARIAEALAGIASSGPRRTMVRAGFASDRVPGGSEFLPVRLAAPDTSGLGVAELAADLVSHRVALLAEADGLLHIPAGTARVCSGDLLEFMPF